VNAHLISAGCALAMGSKCSKAPGGAALLHQASPSSEHFGEEQDDTRQETRVVASNKAQAVQADEHVHKVSYIITQVRGLAFTAAVQVCGGELRETASLEACISQICLHQGHLELASTYNSISSGVAVYNRRFEFVTVQRPSSVEVRLERSKVRVHPRNVALRGRRTSDQPMRRPWVEVRM